MTSSTGASQAADIAAEWWKQTGKRPGAFARIKRAGTLLEIVQEPAALDLIRRLPREDRERLAVLAGVLAWVRETEKASVARQFGAARRKSSTKQPGDKPSKKAVDPRIRQLVRLRANESEAMLRRLRRLVRYLKGTANVHDLAYSILRWGDWVKRRWVFDFYNVPLETAADDKEPKAPHT